jgi:hypothetical protein
VNVRVRPETDELHDVRESLAELTTSMPLSEQDNERLRLLQAREAELVQLQSARDAELTKLDDPPR